MQTEAASTRPVKVQRVDSIDFDTHPSHYFNDPIPILPTVVFFLTIGFLSFRYPNDDCWGERRAALSEVALNGQRVERITASGADNSEWIRVL